MRRLCKPLILTLLLLQLSLSTSAKNVLFINDIKWPPFFFPNVENGNIGLGKEILSLCSNKSSYLVQYKVLPIKRTHLYMESGELDISVYSYKKERESFVHYGKEPIFYTNYGFVSKRSDNIEINSLDDIKHYNFGHLAGLSHTPDLMVLLNKKEKLNQVSIGYDIDAMFGQLLAKPQRFQIMANSIETFAWRAKQLNISDKIKIHDFILKRKPYFITVSKTSKNIKKPLQFLEETDRCIKELKSTDSYLQLTNLYGL